MIEAPPDQLKLPPLCLNRSFNMVATIGKPGEFGRGCEGPMAMAALPKPKAPPSAAGSGVPSPHRSSPPRWVSAAPAFTTTAVVDGDLKTVSLEDYKGK